MYSASIFYTVKIKIIAMPKHTENALTDRKILNAKSKDKQKRNLEIKFWKKFCKKLARIGLLS